MKSYLQKMMSAFSTGYGRTGLLCVLFMLAGVTYVQHATAQTYTWPGQVGIGNPDQASLIIVDDDSLNCSGTDMNCAEWRRKIKLVIDRDGSEAGPTTARFHVEFNHSTTTVAGAAIRVYFKLVDSTATWGSTCSAGVDYTDPTTGIGRSGAFMYVDIPAGQHSSPVIDIPICTDHIIEGDEYFRIELDRAEVVGTIPTHLQGVNFGILPGYGNEKMRVKITDYVPASDMKITLSFDLSSIERGPTGTIAKITASLPAGVTTKAPLSISLAQSGATGVTLSNTTITIPLNSNSTTLDADKVSVSAICSSMYTDQTLSVTGSASGYTFDPSATITLGVNKINIGNTITANPASGQACFGTPLTLTAPSGGTQWSWKIGSVVQGTNSTLSVTALGSATYTVDVTNQYGCMRSSNTFATTIFALPTKPAVSVTGSHSLCSGSTATLNSPGVSDAVKYQWFKDNVQEGSDMSSVSQYTVTAAGTYYLRALTSNGCYVDSDPEVFTGGAGTAPQQPVISAPSHTVCNGGSLLLTATTNVSGATFNWYKNNTIIVTNGPATYLAHPPASGTDNYTVTASNGCESAPSTPWGVTAGGTAPAAPTIQVPNGGVLCTGGTIVLRARPTTGSNYQWFKDGVALVGQNDSLYTAIAPGRYAVSITTGTCTSDTAGVTISTSGTAPAKPTITPSSTGLCTNGTVILTATASGAVSYQWYKDGHVISGQTNATYTVHTQGRYAVSMTEAGGCTSDTTGISINNSGTTAPTKPTINRNPNNNICVNGIVILNAVTAETGITTYNWYKNSVLVATGNDPYYTATTAGYYAVSISNGTCTSDTASLGLNASASTAPNKPTIVPDAATICTNGTVVLRANPSNGTSYQWFLNGHVIPGATTNTYTATQAGAYALAISSGTCMSDTASYGLNSSGTTAPAKPTINPTSTGGLCINGTVILDATTSGATGYQWYKDGALLTGQINATYTVTTAGRYAVSATTGACTSDTAGITINPSGSTAPAKPTINRNPNNNICVNGIVILNAVTTETGITTYNWYKNGVLVTTGNDPYYTATTAGYYAVSISNGTCTSDTASLGLNASASTAPNKPTIVPDAATICTNGTVVLRANPSNGTSYQWFLNGHVIPGATTNTYTAAQAGAYALAISNGTCMSDTASYALNASGTTAPAIPTITPTSTGLCTNGTVILTATASGATSYQWYKDGNVIIGQTNATYTVSTTGRYAVSATTGACTSDTTGITINASGTTAPTKPTINRNPNNNICVNGIVILNAVTTETGITTYNWYKNSVLVATGNDPYYTATTDGYYAVSISNGTCTSDTASLALNASASTAPNKPTIVPDAATICTNGTVVLRANPSNGTSYQWFLNGHVIPGATANNYTASQAGAYALAISNGTCMSDTASYALNLSGTTAPTKPTITATADKICSNNGIVILRATTPGINTYYWYKNGVLVNGYNDSIYTVTTAGYYAVSISNGTCTSDTASKHVPLDGGNTAPSKPTIVPDAATICVGGTVVLRANPSTGTSYQWFYNGHVISGATNATYTATQPGYYALSIANANCMSDTTSYGLNSSGNSAPATPGITADNTTLCNGATATLTATSAETGITGYQWYKDGLLLVGKTSMQLQVTDAGKYQVTVTVGGCTSALSTEQEINSGTGTTPNKPVIIPPAPVTFCSGGSVLLKVNNIESGMTYQWYKNGATLTGETYTTLYVTDAANYTVKATATGGCANTSDLAVVSVSGGPAPNAPSIAATGTDLCTGGSIQLTAVNTPVIPGATYQWYKDGAAIDGATGYTIFVTSTGSYKVTVSDGTCTSVQSPAHTITVPATPGTTPSKPSITAAPSQAMCTGGSVLLTASPKSISETYTWYRNGIVLTGQTDRYLLVKQTGDYSVKVAEVGPGTCSSVSDTVQITLSGNTAPNKPQISSSSDKLCNNGSVLLTAINTPAISGATYQWFRNGLVISGATGNTYTVTTSGKYNVTVVSGTCMSDTSVTKEITTQATPAPNQPNINANPDDLICIGGSVLLTATGSGATSYQWYKDGFEITGATHVTYVATDPAAYYVVAIDGVCNSVSNPKTIGSSASTAPTAPNITASSTTLCANGIIRLTASPVTGATAYQWFRNGVAITGATNQTYDVTYGNDGRYQVTVTLGTCNSDLSTHVDINPSSGTAPDQPTITGSSVICGAGGTVILTASDKVSGTSYQWYKDGQRIAGANGKTYTVTAAGDYAVQVYYGTLAAMGCNSISTEHPVTQGSGSIPPAPSITVSSSSICVGGNVRLTAEYIAGATYTWVDKSTSNPVGTGQTLTITTGGTYGVVATVAGCSSPESVQTVNPSGSAAPNAPAITPDPSTVLCTGGSVLLTASSTTGGVTYEWFNQSGTSIGTFNTLSVTTAGTYSVDAITSAGCRTGTSITITDGSSSAPSAPTVKASTTDLCGSGKAYLSVDQVSGATYQWYRNGDAIAGEIKYTYTATQAGSYTASVVVGGCRSAQSSPAVTLTGTGGSAPTSVTVSAAPSTVLCVDGSILLTATGSSITSYQWYKNGNVITGATGSTYSATTSGLYAVVVGATSGCKSVSNEVTITDGFTQAPDKPSIDQKNAVLCSGGSVTLTASDKPAGTKYQWYRNGLPISNSDSKTYSVTQAGSYNVVIEDGSCHSVWSDTTTVTTSSTPAPGKPTIDKMNPVLCSGGAVTLTASAISSGAYQWYFNGIPIPSATNQTYEATQVGKYNVVVTEGTCNSVWSDTSRVTPSASPAPAQPGLAQSATQICINGSVLLTATDKLPTQSYIWYKDGIVIPGANAKTYSAVAAAKYNVQVVDGTCESLWSITADVQQGSGTAHPQPSIDKLNPTLCINGSVLLTASAKPASTATYQWYLNGSPITGATNQAYSVTVAGSYTVAVVDGGCTSVQSAPSTVTPGGTIAPGQPSIDKHPTATICTNGSVLLTSSVKPLATDKYQWYKNGLPISNSDSRTYAVTDAGYYNVAIISGGCTSVWSDTTTVSLSGTNAPGKPSIDKHPTAELCVNGSVMLTASDKPTTSSTYQWYMNGLPIANATNQTYSATQAGKYNVVVIDGTCNSVWSDTTTITPGTTPAPAKPVITPSGTLSVCVNGSIVLTATNTGTATSFQWYRNGLPITGANAITYPATEVGKYNVMGLNTSCSSQLSDTVFINQGSSSAVPKPRITSTSTVLCNGGSIQLTAVDAVGATGYQWYRNDTLITGATTDKYTVTIAGKYTVIALSAGCSSMLSGPADITQGSGTAPNKPTLDKTTASFCINGSTLLTVTNYTSDVASYVWYKDGSVISGKTAAALNVIDGGIYNVAAIGTSGCSSEWSDNATVSQSANTAPVAPTIQASSSVICTGGSVLLTANSSEPNITGYQWFKDGNVIMGATNSTYSATTNGLYTVTITQSNTCTSLESIGMPLTMGSSAAPAAPSITSATDKLCDGLGIVLTAQSTESGITHYQWFKDHIAISGATAKTYTVSTPGDYTVTVTTGVCTSVESIAKNITMNSSSADCNTNRTVTVVKVKDAAEPSTDGQFRLSLGDGKLVPLAPLTVTYTMSGTATNGVDYQTLSGTVVIPKDSVGVNVDVKVIDDKIIEGNETAIMTLNTATSTIPMVTFAASGQATVNIADDDNTAANRTITILPDSLTIYEGNSMQVIVKLPGTGADAITCAYPITVLIQPGAASVATVGLDYTGIPVSVVIPAGQNSISFTFNALADNVKEGDELVVMEGSASSALADPFSVISGQTTIIDVADLPSLVVNPAPAPQCGGTYDLFNAVISTDPGVILHYYDDWMNELSSSVVSEAGTYTIIAEGPGGWTSLPKDVEVVIYVRPVVNLNTQPMTACAPSTIDLTNGIANYDALNYNYVFTGPAPSLAVVANPASISVNGQYTVVATSASPTLVPCPSVSKVITVQINPKPVVTTTNPAARCAPAAFNLTANVNGYNTTVFDYTFTAPNGSVVTTPAAVTDSGTYKVTATNKATGCVSNEATIEVTKYPKPGIDTVANGMAICGSGTVDLRQGITNYSQLTASSFIFRDPSNNTLSNVSALTTPGKYTIMYQNSYGCRDTATITLTKYQLPVVNITDPAPVYQPFTVDVTVPAVTAGSVVNAPGNLTFTYFDINPADQITADSAKKISIDGTYYIVGTTDVGCSSVKTPVNVIIKTRPTVVIIPKHTEIWEGESDTLTIKYVSTDPRYLTEVVTLPQDIEFNISNAYNSQLLEGEFSLSNTVTIPKNTNSAEFYLQTWDNNVIELDRIMRINGIDVTNIFDTARAQINVHDSTSLKPGNLVITIGKDTIYRSGTVELKVSLPQGIRTAFDINLTVDRGVGTTIDASQYVFNNTNPPVTVTIPANSNEGSMRVKATTNSKNDLRLVVTGSVTPTTPLREKFSVIDGEVIIKPSRIDINPLVSDNGDGINDYFQIGNIQKYPSKVIIFSRWQDVIFEVDNYDNSNLSKRFDGRRNKGGSQRVPDGVYFYRIEITVPQNDLTSDEPPVQRFEGYLRLQK